MQIPPVFPPTQLEAAWKATTAQSIAKMTSARRMWCIALLAGAKSAAEIEGWGGGEMAAAEGVAAAAPAPAPAPRVVVVDGPIGAGKSTLVAALAEALRAAGLGVVAVPEPVDDWVRTGILGAFYADPARYAALFQLHVLPSRIRAIARALAAAPAPPAFVLLERSPASDRVFWALQRRALPAADVAVYEEWAAHWGPACPVDLAAATCLYLRPEVGACMARLAARGRPGEEGVGADYQRELVEAHDAFLLGAPAPGLPGLGRAPYRRVVPLPPALAAADFRPAAPGRAEAVAAVLALLA